MDKDESNFEIELTDGWYSVWTNIDPAMINLIKQGKVKIGTKLVSQSIELLNCADGCDPLEVLIILNTLKILVQLIYTSNYYLILLNPLLTLQPLKAFPENCKF